MAVLDFTHLTSFAFQYIIATIVAAYAFHTLRNKRFYSRPDFLLHRHSRLERQFELIGLSFYSTIEHAVSALTSPIVSASFACTSLQVPGTDLRSAYYPGCPVTVAPQYIRRNPSSFKAPSTRVHFPELYEKSTFYDAYVAVFAVSVWAGILLLLTPYNSIFVFIPHFSILALNLAIIIVLSITIFEGSIATIYLFIGTGRRQVSAMLLAVIAIFTLSILTPSFNWFHTYTTMSEIFIYSILAALILSITFLISLFKDRGVLFRLSMYSSFVSYGFFIVVTMYNVLLTAIH